MILLSCLKEIKFSLEEAEYFLSLKIWKEKTEIVINNSLKAEIHYESSAFFILRGNE